MCAVSNISDWGYHRWPEPTPYVQQYPLGTPYMGPTRQEWEEFKKLLEAALKFDEATGQPDCVDPKKQEWMKSVEERLKRLENA